MHELACSSRVRHDKGGSGPGRSTYSLTCAGRRWKSRRITHGVACSYPWARSPTSTQKGVPCTTSASGSAESRGRRLRASIWSR